MSAADVATARRAYEAIARGDLETIRGFLDPAVRWHGGDESAPGACHNRDDVLEFIRGALDRGSVGRLVDVIDAGADQVILVMEPAAGEARANLVTFSAGKVVEMVACDSAEEALERVRGR